MALVLDLGMAAGSLAGTIVETGWRLGSAWLGRVESSTATGTADFVEYGFEATRARSFVTQLLAGMISALQGTATNFETDVFSFEILISSRCCV
jgi:hypothetical protein